MKEINITVSGTVKDHNTGQLIGGASISTSLQRGSMPGNSLSTPTYRTISEFGGSFTFQIKALSVKDISSLPIGMRGYVIAIKASKSGFTDGIREEIRYINGQDTNINLELIK